MKRSVSLLPEFEWIESWEACGSTQVAFCKKYDIPTWRFYEVLKDYRSYYAAKKQKSVSASVAGIIPLQLSPKQPATPDSAPVEVIFPGGARIQFNGSVQASFLKELLS